MVGGNGMLRVFGYVFVYADHSAYSTSLTGKCHRNGDLLFLSTGGVKWPLRRRYAAVAQLSEIFAGARNNLSARRNP